METGLTQYVFMVSSSCGDPPPMVLWGLLRLQTGQQILKIKRR